MSPSSLLVIISVSLNLQFWVYERLNDPITIPELLMAVNTLKQGTSVGNDSLLNEYFVETIDIFTLLTWV